MACPPSPSPASWSSLIAPSTRAARDFPKARSCSWTRRAWWTSATLARLISHTERAQSKLVLVGDPEQLGEIEAGGLFRAIADRAEPIHLDEVNRHRHELDRVAVRRIREGEGREALGLYESGERVTVAPNAEARREAMVHDWHEAFEQGEGAVMVAKRNVDVEKLNAMAREVRKQAGQLGADEIEVGDARFAPGDLIITRVNDRSAAIYNRERWRIAEVDAKKGSAVLEGIDQARTVEVGADYLVQTDPHSEAPAIQHAYAVTTYSAQGSTFERAFGSGAASLRPRDWKLLRSQLYVKPRKSHDHLNLLAKINRRVAAHERSVSSFCHATFLGKCGKEGQSKVFVEKGESAPFEMPYLVGPIDLSGILRQSHEHFLRVEEGKPEEELDVAELNEELKRRP